MLYSCVHVDFRYGDFYFLLQCIETVKCQVSINTATPTGRDAEPTGFVMVTITLILQTVARASALMGTLTTSARKAQIKVQLAAQKSIPD